MHKHNRKLTPRMAEFLALAKQHHLPNPLGRACYAYNRHINAGLGPHPAQGYAFEPTTFVYYPNGTGAPASAVWRPATALTVMQSCRATTAARWLKHWQAGRPLKGLRYTVASLRATRRKWRGYQQASRVWQAASKVPYGRGLWRVTPDVGAAGSQYVGR